MLCLQPGDKSERERAKGGEVEQVDMSQHVAGGEKLRLRAG